MAAKRKKTVETAVPDGGGRRAATASGPWRSVNRVQLAALLGVHPDTVTDYAREGMPVLTPGGRGVEGSYDAVDCLDWWRSRQGRNAKENAQTMLYTNNAELARVKLAQQMGQLLPAEQVIKDGQAFVKGWLALVRAWPRRLVQLGLIAREEEPGVTQNCRQLLIEIASWKSVADIQRSVKRSDAAA